MWRNRRALSWRDILDFRLRLHAVAEVSAQEVGRVEVHSSADDFGKLSLHGEKRQPGYVLWLEFDKNIHIAGGAKIVPQDGAEKSQLADVVSPAKVSNSFSIKRDVRHFNLPNCFQSALQCQIRCHWSVSAASRLEVDLELWAEDLG